MRADSVSLRVSLLAKRLAGAISLLSVLVVMAQAQAADRTPACAPVLDGVEKMLRSDHRAVTEAGGRKAESITVNGISYVKADNRPWTVSRLSPQDAIEQQRDNLKNARSMTCEKGGQSTIDGESATSYRVRTEVGEVRTEATLWLSDGSGMPLRSDQVISGPKEKQELKTSYGYRDIRIPPL